MENYVAAQIVTFAQALLMGAVSGCLYDLLRAVRLACRRDWLTHIMDGLYTAAVLLLVWLFALQRGEGELRLYMLAAMALGAAVYFWLFSAALRPMWDFWVHVAANFGKLLWIPAKFVAETVKKVENFAKKLFYFWEKYATIKKYKWDCPYLSEKYDGRGGGSNHEKEKKRKKTRRHDDAGGGAADRRGHR